MPDGHSPPPWEPPLAPAQPLTASERVRRHKWRAKHELTQIHGLDVPIRAIAALVALGLLKEHQSEDRQAIRAAFERYIGETLGKDSDSLAT